MGYSGTCIIILSALITLGLLSLRFLSLRFLSLRFSVPHLKLSIYLMLDSVFFGLPLLQKLKLIICCVTDFDALQCVLKLFNSRGDLSLLLKCNRFAIMRNVLGFISVSPYVFQVSIHSPRIISEVTSTTPKLTVLIDTQIGPSKNGLVVVKFQCNIDQLGDCSCVKIATDGMGPQYFLVCRFILFLSQWKVMFKNGFVAFGTTQPNYLLCFCKVF